MSREAFLKLILPGLLVVFVYWVAAPRFLGTRGESINPRPAAERARSQIAAARSSAPSYEQLLREGATVGDLTETVAAAKAKKAAVEKRCVEAEGQLAERERQWVEFISPPPTAVRRTQLLARVEAVLTSHKLTPLEQGTATGVQVPAGLRPVLEPAGTSGPTGADAGRVFKFRFRGKYTEVAAALDELAGKNWSVFPVGLMMEEADFDQPLRSWTLLVWV